MTRCVTLFSPKLQQSMRQWSPFANDNEANVHKAIGLDWISPICRIELRKNSNVLLWPNHFDGSPFVGTFPTSNTQFLFY